MSARRISKSSSTKTSTKDRAREAMDRLIEESNKRVE
jgi:hypothetical protein